MRSIIIGFSIASIASIAPICCTFTLFGLISWGFLGLWLVCINPVAVIKFVIYIELCGRRVDDFGGLLLHACAPDL